MADDSFLAEYDPAAYARPSVAVDCVLAGISDGELAVLVHRRDAPPFKDALALPGGFVGIEESLDEAARRVLAVKAGGAEVCVEQLASFGDPARDPRMRVISVAYYALVSDTVFDTVIAAGDGLARHFPGRDSNPPLAFDHDAIVAMAVGRLRGRLDYTPIALQLLGKRFTLRALQQVHEAILGRPLNKPAFRRRMLDSGWIEATGIREEGGAFRPAELYQRKL